MNLNAGRMKRNLEHGKNYQMADVATLMRLKAATTGQLAMLRR